MNANGNGLVCGNQVQHDKSGVGHNWRNIDASDIPANIIEELEGEVIDGGLLSGVFGPVGPGRG